jgi:uncharacterized protein
MKNNISTTALVSAFTAGLVFALGLVLSGMSQPSVVLGFLDVTALSRGVQPWVADGWNPSLVLVMGGALMVTLIGFAITPKKTRKPWHADKFELPTRKDIDTPLVLGGVMFGAGWGLAGYCPGPALASVLSGGADALIFTVTMLIGMVIAKIASRK